MPMGLTVERTCRTCGHPVYVQGAQTRGLGKPYVRCSNCKSMILLGRRNEWQLKSPASRAMHTVAQCGPAIVVPLLLPLAVWFGVWICRSDRMMGGRVNMTLMTALAIGAYVLVVAIAVRSALKRLSGEIRQSRRRMLNADYRHKLKHMGLLKEQPPDADGLRART